MDLRTRYRGALLGLAVGDALGTLELSPPGSFEPVSRMEGGGPFGLAPGQWTDDTSMTLCLAESLVERGGFDPADQMRRYLRWYREGYLSSTGVCFDVGNTVRAVLAAGHCPCGECRWAEIREFKRLWFGENAQPVSMTKRGVQALASNRRRSGKRGRPGQR